MKYDSTFLMRDQQTQCVYLEDCDTFIFLNFIFSIFGILVG